MAEVFDAGPLSWVKDEIDRSLKKVQDNFATVTEKPEEFATLRFTIAHLYQVSGALDMVGLEGCKRYCAEIEKLASKLEKQEISVTPALMAHMSHAVSVLEQYLQDLLNGYPDVPTRLYDSIKPLVEAQGETLEITDLFFPDTSFNAPKDLPINALPEFAVPLFVAEQRSIFQKSLLDWLRNNDAEALARMREAVVHVQQVQHKSAQKTLWWAAIALMDALSQEKIAVLSGAKKLCRRLDQQLRNMSEGETKTPSQLLRDVLYYVAISDRSTETISRVKETFELDQVLPSEGVSASGQSNLTTESERAALAQLSADLPMLKDLWTRISENQLSSEDLVTFVEKLQHLSNVQQGLNNQAVYTLIHAINTAANALQADPLKINEVSLIEIAAALNLLEYISEHYAHLDVEMQAKITTQTARLHAVVDGVPLVQQLEVFKNETKLDASVLEAVAKQVLAALQQAEKAFDAFFRNPADAALLEDTVKPLQQVSAAFEMLEMPTQKSISDLSLGFVQYFKEHIGYLEQSTFELLAESLSMLGLYAEELPHPRTESELALQGAQNRLEQSAQALDIIQHADIAEASQAQASTTEETIQVTEPVVTSYPKIDGLDDLPRITDPDSTIDDVTDEAIDEELQEIFLAEAEEVLINIAQYLKALSVNGSDSEALADLRRAYHTLKGSGRTVGLVGMSKVAWAIEKLLNLIIEHKAFPSPQHLAFIERVTGAFARCVGHLQADKKVTLNPTIFQKEAATYEREFELAITGEQPKPLKEEVLIGGTRKLSREFFNIFLHEAQQHLATLAEAQSALTLNSTELPTDASCRAAHTLGSNALTAGFKPTGDLARALEYWLDEHRASWTAQHINLYANVVKALSDGIERIKTLKNPKSSRALIVALGDSTAQMQAIAAQQAEAAVLELEKEMLSAGISVDKLKVKVPPAGKAVDKKQKQEINKPAVLESFEPDTQEKPSADVATVALDEIAVFGQQPTLSAETEISEPKLATSQQVSKSQVPVDQELLALFTEEARELVPQVGRDLRGWRNNPHETEYSDSLQRALHTLKGSARMAGLATIGDSVHLMEDRVIHALRNAPTPNDFDEMFAEFDRIGNMLEDITGGDNVTPP
ncbi:MAG TPA: Hpt domain-containing protein, partial [Rugosibacter sp.]|nr:Hpt domain-containing protein [Rugosibacter sp.]